MVQFSTNDDPLDAAGGRVRRHATSDGSETNRWGTFTVQSANQMLPLVERIVLDLIGLSRELEQQGAQIRGIEHLPNPSNLAAFADELSAIKESFSTDRQRLESCYRELSSLGVKVDSLQDGAIDFPGFLNRRPVLLCWKVGEPAVTHWHHPDECFPSRRVIGDHSFDAAQSSVAQAP